METSDLEITSLTVRIYVLQSARYIAIGLLLYI